MIEFLNILIEKLFLNKKLHIELAQNEFKLDILLNFC